jgi:hypothetical protein
MTTNNIKILFFIALLVVPTLACAERCGQEVFIKNQTGDLRFGAIQDPPKGSDYSVWFPIVPYALAFDSLGNIYVGDSVNYRVMKFNKEGKFLLKFKLQSPIRTKKPELSHEIRSIAIDKDDNVYVLNLLEYRVEIYSPSGKFLRKIDYFKEKLENLTTKPRIMMQPLLVNVDPKGNVYLVGIKDGNRSASGAIYNEGGAIIKKGVALGDGYNPSEMVGASPYTVDVAPYAPDKKKPGEYFTSVKVKDRTGSVVWACDGIENLNFDEGGPAIETDRYGNLYSFDTDNNVIKITANAKKHFPTSPMDADRPK